MALRPVLFNNCYHYGHFYEVMTIHLKELFSIHFLLWLQIQEQNLLTHLSGIFPDHFSTFANQKKPLTPGEILLEDFRRCLMVSSGWQRWSANIPSE
jgi:hypothetical protein